MAICLRRILRKYSSFTYSGVNGQHAFREQKNPPIYIAPSFEVSQNCWVPRVPALNCLHQHDAKKNEKDKTESKIMDFWKDEVTLLEQSLFSDKLYLSALLEKELLYCAKECEAYKVKVSQKEIGSPFDKPDLGQLQRIYEKLCDDLPRIFQRSIDTSIYHENMIFENNIRGTRTVGIGNYLKQIMFLRVYVIVKFTHVKFEILKITTHVEDGTVRVRWRISGVSGFKTIFAFWKVKFWNRDIIEKENGWVDGFSIFYVKGDGLVHKHVASKLMPNDSRSTLGVKHPLAAKVALIVGLISNDFSPHLPDVDNCSEKGP